MANDRSYRKSFLRDKASCLIEKEKNKRFDSAVVDALPVLHKKAKYNTGEGNVNIAKFVRHLLKFILTINKIMVN